MTTMDETNVATKAEVRRHVVAALRERAEVMGDKLAEGAVRVIEELEAQANRRAGAAS